MPVIVPTSSGMERDQTMEIRVSIDEKARIKAGAKADSRTASDFVRVAALREARGGVALDIPMVCIGGVLDGRRVLGPADAPGYEPMRVGGAAALVPIGMSEPMAAAMLVRGYLVGRTG